MSKNDQPETSQPPIARTSVEPPPLVRSSPEELAAAEASADELWIFWTAQGVAADVADYFDLPVEHIWNCFLGIPDEVLGLFRTLPGQVAVVESAVSVLAPDHPLRGTFKPTVVIQ